MMLDTNAHPKPKPVKIIRVKRKKKVSDRKKLEKQLDLLCREIVLDRDVHCVCPPPAKGHSQVLQSGHLITRSKESVRWDLYNCSCQCSSCNLSHEYMPHRYTNWFISKFGTEEYFRLCRDGDEVIKLQLYELSELLEQLREIRKIQILKSLEGIPYSPRFYQKDILSGAWKK